MVASKFSYFQVFIPVVVLTISLMPKQKHPTARKVGKVLAHLQSTLDDVVEWGFKKMREAGDREEEMPKEPETLGEKGRSALKKTAKFLGQTGESFYESYEKLKAEKVNKKKSTS